MYYLTDLEAKIPRLRGEQGLCHLRALRNSLIHSCPIVFVYLAFFDSLAWK